MSSQPTQADDGGAREREPDEPLEMYLCEASAVVLKPQTYRFIVDPDCELCKKAEIEATSLTPAPGEPGEDGRAAIRGIVLAAIPAGTVGSDFVDALVDRLIAALAPKEEPVAEYQWRSTYDRPGKWWNGSRAEIASHGKVGCETRELFTRPAVEPGAAREVGALNDLLCIAQVLWQDGISEPNQLGKIRVILETGARLPAAQGERGELSEYGFTKNHPDCVASRCGAVECPSGEQPCYPVDTPKDTEANDG